MPSESSFLWKEVGNRKALPIGKKFLVWIPRDDPELTVVRAAEVGGDIVIYYADDALLDARPRYVRGATHWADYLKGPA